MNIGERSVSIVEGNESVAVSLGVNGKAKGKKGCWLVLAEWGNGGRKDVQSVLVDGDKIKADTFYLLKDGKFVEE